MVFRTLKITLSVVQVPAGEEHLGYGDFQRLEEGAVGVHQVVLADGGKDLTEGDLAGLFLHTQGLHTGGDGARGNQQYFFSLTIELPPI